MITPTVQQDHDPAGGQPEPVSALPVASAPGALQSIAVDPPAIIPSDNVDNLPPQLPSEEHPDGREGLFADVANSQVRKHARDFLDALYEHRNHEEALKSTGVRWPVWASMVRVHPSIALEYRAVCALNEFRRKLGAREELYRRAIDGWDEPVYGRIGKDQDGQIGTAHKYSDRLLLAATQASHSDFRNDSGTMAAAAAGARITINIGVPGQRDLSGVPEVKMDAQALPQTSARRKPTQTQ